MNHQIKQRFPSEVLMLSIHLSDHTRASRIKRRFRVNSIHPQFPSSVIKHREQFKTVLGTRSLKLPCKSKLGNGSCLLGSRVAYFYFLYCTFDITVPGSGREKASRRHCLPACFNYWKRFYVILYYGCSPHLNLFHEGFVIS